MGILIIERLSKYNEKIYGTNGNLIIRTFLPKEHMNLDFNNYIYGDLRL